MTTTNPTEVHFQVPSFSDLDGLHEFAQSQLKRTLPDETERMFYSWTAPWRKESLEHYLKLAWSFVAKEGSAQNPGPVCGFFLAQPMLFQRGHTQSLWVESVLASTPSLQLQLCDIAIRVAREKHFQRVLFNQSISRETDLSLLTAGQAKLMADEVYEVRTSKDLGC